MIKDSYFHQPQVSNSDLSWLEYYFMPPQRVFDLTKAYAFGSLIDAMITEPDKVNYFKLQVKGIDYQFTKDDFDKAQKMKLSFYKDEFCRMIINRCSFQKVSVKLQFEIEYCGWKFILAARCKWDFFDEKVDFSGDIKSTTATTQKQCEALVDYFNYDRSRAWYMDIEGRSNDILIFISKVNFKIFKVVIKKGGEIYNRGKAKYQELAFRWWYLFGDLTPQGFMDEIDTFPEDDFNYLEPRYSLPAYFDENDRGGTGHGDESFSDADPGL